MFGCSVAEMLTRVSSAELAEWMAFFKLEEEDQAEADRRDREAGD